MDNSTDDIQPRMGDDTVYIPMSFEPREDSSKTLAQRLLVPVCSIIIAIFVITLTLLSKDMDMSVKIVRILFSVIIVGVILHIKEKQYRLSLKSLEENNYKLDIESFWGLYDSEKTPPYIRYFKNGEIGVFVKFEKGIIIGDVDKLEFAHFEAISNAYNIYAKTNLVMTHIDIMDNIGEDNRMNALYDVVRSAKSEALKALYTAIYENAREVSERTYASHDYYAIRGRLSRQDFLRDIDRILTAFMEGNYVSYKMLNDTDLRKLTESLLNIREFSVLDAYSNCKGTYSNTYITPIRSVRQNNEIIVLNKTDKEKEIERRIRREEELVKKGKKKFQNKEIDIN